jgi:hypothetical protein
MAPKTEKRYMIWVVYRFLGHKMTSNEKSLNYKVIDLVESYNFYINFIFIRVHTKKIWFFKRTGSYRISHGVCRRYITRTCKRRTTQWLEHCSTSNRRIVWHLNPNAMWYGGSSIVLQNLKLVKYFWKNRKKIHILRSIGLKSSTNIGEAMLLKVWIGPLISAHSDTKLGFLPAYISNEKTKYLIIKRKIDSAKVRQKKNFETARALVDTSTLVH